MLFSARTQLLAQDDYPNILKKIIDWGFDGVEISVLDQDFKLRSDFFSGPVIKVMKRLLKQLEAASISCHLDYVNQKENIEVIRKTFAVAQKLDIDTIIINGAASQAETEQEAYDEWQLMIEKTQILCELAQKAEIKLAKEFEPGFITDSTAKLIKVFNQVDPLPLYANLDLGHVYLNDPQPLTSITKLQDRIIHGHIENMKQGVHDHLMPSEGDMDLASYLNELKKINFKGPLALDLYKYDYEEAAPAALEQLRQLENSI